MVKMLLFYVQHRTNCSEYLSNKEDDLDLVVSPNHSLERTDNQSAKTDITRELAHKEADLAHIDERIEELGRM